MLPSLVQVNEKDRIVSEASNSMSGWHRNDKRKNIVDESVECFVHKCFPRQMSY